MSRHLLPILLFTLPAKAESVFKMDDFATPLHGYWEAAPKDRFSTFMAKVKTGADKLDTTSEKAFLTSLLVGLEIPASSQLLVYSTTSLQKRLINPENPRALYFNEDTYIGFVSGGKIEVASYDQDLGLVFFIFDLLRPAADAAVPKYDRPTGCLNCHAESASRYLPGFTIESVAVSSEGSSLETFRRGEMGHAVPIKDRFGGWHLTGGETINEHHANSIGALSAGTLTLTANPPGASFTWERFPVRTSDILPHLIHEHQVEFLNQLTQLRYLERRLQSTPSTTDKLLFTRHMSNFVDYVLFKDEAALPTAGITGDPVFKAHFLSHKASKFLQLDLKTRLLTTRCSYMLETDVWKNASPSIKQAFNTALAAKLANGGAEHLSSEEKSEIKAWVKTQG